METCYRLVGQPLEKGYTMRLRNMSASVQNVRSIELQLKTGELVTLENASVLTSYQSRVAVYCRGTVYLLPRYDYSVTTWKHIHAFVQDYWCEAYDYDAKTIRDIASGKLGGDEYVFADAIVTRFNGNVWTDRY